MRREKERFVSTAPGNLCYRFIEHVQWKETNYRSVLMSKQLTPS
jgi:hypothetical protein